MEIERKFLTKEIPFSLEIYPKKEISQCYISTEPTIRIRQSGQDYILTVKGSGAMAKEEFELPISQEAYKRLLQKAETPAVEKIRYFIPLQQGLTAEVDIYGGKLQGLMTTEVEFESIAQAQAFVPPAWFGKDVTMDHRYKNTSLSIYGIPQEE